MARQDPKRKDTIAKLRKITADRKVLEEDNKKRAKENKPLRTIYQYQADTAPQQPSPPPAPLPPTEQDTPASGKPRMFDPRDPPTNRLPTMKIPHAKTDEEYQAVARSRQQMADLRRSGLSSSSLTSTTRAGVKRKIDEQDINVQKKPKMTAATAVNKKDKVDEKSGRPQRQNVFHALMNRGKEAAKKPAAANRAKSANADAKDVDGKKDTGEGTAKTKAVAGMKRKFEGGQDDAAKRTKTEATSKPTKAGIETIAADTGKPDSQNKSEPPKTAKAAHDDKAERREESTKLESPAKSGAKTSSTANGDGNSSSMKIENISVDTQVLPNSAQVDPTTTRVQGQDASIEDGSVNAEQQGAPDQFDAGTVPGAEESATNAKSTDKTECRGEQTLTQDAGSEAGKKRKGDEDDDEVAGSAKRPKLESIAAEKNLNSLQNYDQACFINASLHLVHSIPAFAALKNVDADTTGVDNKMLTETEMELASTSGKTRQKKSSRAKLRRFLRKQADREELKLMPYLSDLMMLLSAHREEPQQINPFLFQQVCGEMFSGNEEAPMNGETQEDAHEFITKLIEQVNKERPDLDIEELSGTEFVQQQVCECGEVKSFTETCSTLNIPQHMQSNQFRLQFRTTVLKYLQDQSIFDDYRCGKCGETGKWSLKDGWEGRRITTAPEHFLVNLSRGKSQSRGRRTERVKLMTMIVPPIKKLLLYALDGTKFRYHLVAMIKHTGSELHKGHYTTIRKIDNQWWHCDDAGMGGNKRLTRAEVETHEDGCVFLLKRVDHEDEIDEAT